MIDITYLTQYAQCRVIFEGLRRAGNHQARIYSESYGSSESQRDTEYIKYQDLLEAANQAQLACDRALLAIAQAVIASDTPYSDISNMLNDISMHSYSYLTNAIVPELQAITQEAQ